MGIINSLLKNLGFSEEEDLKTYKVVQNLPVSAKKEEKKSVPTKNIVTIRPKKFEDIEKSVDALINGECSIIDMGDIKYDEISRILDFLSGAVYALRAELRRLQGDLYLLIPNNVKLKNVE